MPIHGLDHMLVIIAVRPHRCADRRARAVGGSGRFHGQRCSEADRNIYAVFRFHSSNKESSHLSHLSERCSHGAHSIASSRDMCVSLTICVLPRQRSHRK